MVTSKNINIPREDQEFITRVLLPHFGIKVVRLSWSDSKKKWPDIWYTCPDSIPTVTVTREWRRQGVHERRKRIVHELLHHKGLNHGVIDGLKYSTVPAEDEYSKAIYRQIIGKTKKNPGVVKGVQWVWVVPQTQRALDWLLKINLDFEFGKQWENEGLLMKLRDFASMKFVADRTAGIRPDEFKYYKATEEDVEKYSAVVSKNPKKKPNLEWGDPDYRPKGWTNYDDYYEDLSLRFDWPLIKKTLQVREETKPSGSEYPSYYYLGNYLNFGPETLKGKKQHFHDIIHNDIVLTNRFYNAQSWRLGVWFEALVALAKEHGLYVKMGEDPADLYVAVGEPKSRPYLGGGVDQIEGF